jgi:hypothetical protein
LRKGRQKLEECLDVEYSLDAVKNVYRILRSCFAERHVSGSNKEGQTVQVLTFDEIMTDVGNINGWDKSQKRMQDFERELNDSVESLKKALNMMKKSHVFAHEFKKQIRNEA